MVITWVSLVDTWVDIVSVSVQGSNGRLPNILWVTRTPRIKVEYVKIER